jgi:signal peptidase II
LEYPINQRVEAAAPLYRKSFIILFGSLFSLTLDQLTKFWVTACFRSDETLAVFPNWFSITLRANPGASFGLFRGKPLPFFLSISSLAVVFILYFVFRADPKRQKLIWAMSLILGGALGNNSDRLFRGGAVIDFLDFHFRSLTWPTFNVADISIVTGVILFLLDMARHEMRADSKGSNPWFENNSSDGVSGQKEDPMGSTQ